MFLSHKNGPAIAHIPKSASQTIRMVLAPLDEISCEDAMKFGERVMFVRDPFDRLGSAYSFFLFLQQKTTKIEPPVPKIDCYETFVDWALETEDVHVRPQVEFVTTDDGEFVPNRLHWLKDIMDVWNDYYPGLVPDKSEFPHRHKCQRLDVSDYRRDDLSAKYAKDIELCRML
jgi:hypothetical protein